MADRRLRSDIARIRKAQGKPRLRAPAALTIRIRQDDMAAAAIDGLVIDRFPRTDLSPRTRLWDRYLGLLEFVIAFYGTADPRAWNVEFDVRHGRPTRCARRMRKTKALMRRHGKSPWAQLINNLLTS